MTVRASDAVSNLPDWLLSLGVGGGLLIRNHNVPVIVLPRERDIGPLASPVSAYLRLCAAHGVAPQVRSECPLPGQASLGTAAGSQLIKSRRVPVSL